MRLTRFLTTTVLALAVALPAQADDSRSRIGNTRFRGMDRNGDGVITRREWAGNSVSFRNHDLNGDGVLTGREIGVAARPRAWRSEHQRGVAHLNREQYFRVLDENRDGVLSPWEYDDANLPFHWVDFNRDGVLTWSEWRESRSSRWDQDRRTGELFVDDERLNDFFRLDRNEDDFLTRGEWRGSFWSFQRLDRDDDGRVHISEYLGG